MPGQVDPVILRLEAEVADYNRKIDGAQKLTDQKLSAIEAKGFAMGQNLKRGFDLAKGAAIAYAASVGVSTLLRAAQAGLEYASSLGEQAQQLGVTTDALQVYRYAATQVGLSSEEMDQALSQLTRRIGEAASGTKAQAEAFDKLGITVKDVTGNVLETGDAIPMIADALSRIESPAERAAIELDLFGRAGQKLEPLLAGGSAAINNLAKAAHEAGAVLSPELIRNADDAADALAKVKFELQASIATAVARDSAAIIGLAKALGTLIEFLGRAGLALAKFQQLQKLSSANLKQYSPFPGVRRQGKREAGEAREEFINLKLQGAGLTLDSVTSDLPGARKSGGIGAAAVAAPKIGGGGGSGGGGGGGAGPTGPSQQDIAARFQQELFRNRARLAAAAERSALSAEQEAEFSLQQLENNQKAAQADLARDEDYSAAQKEHLSLLLETIAEQERQNIEADKRRRIEQETAELADVIFRGHQAALEIQRDLANTAEDRRRLSLEIFDAEDEYRRSVLRAVLASDANTAAKQRAQAELDALDSTSSARRKIAERETEGPLARYARGFGDPATDAEQLVVDEIEHFRDGIRSGIEKVTGTKDPLINGLIQILVEQLLLRPMAEALAGVSGGGGGGLGSLIGSLGSIFGVGGGIGGGRASGGPVMGGRMYRVNEGASPGRVEGFIPQGSGQIVPLGRMNAMANNRPSIVQPIINVDARGAVMNDDFARMILRQSQDQANVAAGQAYSRSIKDAPAAVQNARRYGRR